MTEQNIKKVRQKAKVNIQKKHKEKYKIQYKKRRDRGGGQWDRLGPREHSAQEVEGGRLTGHNL